MSEIPKAYEPQSVEDKWYQFWLDEKCFTADPKSAKPAYSIVIPPPNVTGVLHMGHVLNNTIQDILTRKARMDGKEVLWLPGTDHAGIATQVMVEKQVKKEEHKSKYDLGREEFLKRVWAWKEKHGDIIISQLKKLGCSCDWTRERFTMDPEYSRNVQRVFVDLYKKGLIYRGNRMVNWCPATQTALSDEEVEMKPQKGFMYHFKVQVAEEPNTWLTIATTRPETIPGDTAVAVNPKDARYTHLIGKHIIRPLPHELPREQKLIPIIGDDHVDFEFGTGVLKVTPAHDKADFDIGQRHKLPLLDIMNPDATMNDLAGADLKSLDRFKARKVAVEKLTELGALMEEKPYENNVGYSERAGVPIEPRLSEQWFLKYPSVEKSKACVEQSDDSEGQVTRVPNSNAECQGLSELVPPDDGKMRFHPQRWAKVYDHWLTNIQDWCISRQLWWGHRIPVWTLSVRRNGVEQMKLDGLRAALAFEHKNREDKGWATGGFPLRSNAAPVYFRWLYDSGEFIQVSAATDSSEDAKILEDAGFTQDPDVLDTWFSSWLWPFATMGWPEKTETLKKFYPTNDLVTAPEIIFFWVARMIMAGFEYMGELPFRDVYFTGIVRDKQGRKMSKTLGNSPDPLDLIAKYGADAIRFGTMRSAPLGQDVLFDEKDVELGRNFCNKLWNACRFRQMVGGKDEGRMMNDEKAPTAGDSSFNLHTSSFPIQGEINPQLLNNDDKWILLKLNQAIREITDALATYNFSIATQTLYRFFWSEYCDWYVEASKTVVSAVSADSRLGTADATAVAKKANTLAVIDFILSHTLRLFHPFLPFITEELWHGMGYAEDMPDNQGGKTIMFAPWPKPFDQDFRDHYGLDDCYLDFAAQKYELVTLGRNMRREANIAANKKVRFILKPANELPPHDVEVLKLLLNAEALDIDPNYETKKGTLAVRAAMGELFLPLEGLVDVEAEKARLKKETEKYKAEISKVEQKLANPSFTQKVPPQVLEEHKKRLAEWQAKLEQVNAALAVLG